MVKNLVLSPQAGYRAGEVSLSKGATTLHSKPLIEQGAQAGFPSSAGIGPFISFHFQMRDSSNFSCTIMGKREKLQDVHTVVLMKQIDSFKHCSCHVY